MKTKIKQQDTYDGVKCRKQLQVQKTQFLLFGDFYSISFLYQYIFTFWVIQNKYNKRCAISPYDQNNGISEHSPKQN